MSILPRFALPAVEPEEHWHQDDLDLEAEREYRREQDRRFGADPTPEDVEFWFAETRDDDEQEDDASLDERAAESVAMGRYEAGLDF